MPFFQTDFTLPGTHTASGRPMRGSLNGPFPNEQAARDATASRHPDADLGATTRLDD